MTERPKVVKEVAARGSFPGHMFDVEPRRIAIKRDVESESQGELASGPEELTERYCRLLRQGINRNKFLQEGDTELVFRQGTFALLLRQSVGGANGQVQSPEKGQEMQVETCYTLYIYVIYNMHP